MRTVLLLTGLLALWLAMPGLVLAQEVEAPPVAAAPADLLASLQTSGLPIVGLQATVLADGTDTGALLSQLTGYTLLANWQDDAGRAVSLEVFISDERLASRQATIATILQIERPPYVTRVLVNPAQRALLILPPTLRDDEAAPYAAWLATR